MRSKQAEDEKQEQDKLAAASLAAEGAEAVQESEEVMDDRQGGSDSGDPAARLAEEGLDPMPPAGTGQRACRRVSSGRPTRLDIQAKMQQNQQRLRQVCQALLRPDVKPCGQANAAMQASPETKSCDQALRLEKHA